MGKLDRLNPTSQLARAGLLPPKPKPMGAAEKRRQAEELARYMFYDLLGTHQSLIAGRRNGKTHRGLRATTHCVDEFHNFEEAEDVLRAGKKVSASICRSTSIIEVESCYQSLTAKKDIGEPIEIGNSEYKLLLSDVNVQPLRGGWYEVTIKGELV